MTGAAKRKGDQAEREAIAVLGELGLPARRRYGAGVTDDIGDLTIGAGTIVQVKNLRDFGRACIECAYDAEVQAEKAGVVIGVGMARRRGGTFVVTLTPATFAWLAHAAGLVNHENMRP